MRPAWLAKRKKRVSFHISEEEKSQGNYLEVQINLKLTEMACDHFDIISKLHNYIWSKGRRMEDLNNLETRGVSNASVLWSIPNKWNILYSSLIFGG